MNDHISDQTIAAWDEKELIGNVYHQLRQKSTTVRGIVQMLADGGYGFTSQEQQEVIEWLQRDVNAIAEINRWLQVWKMAHQQQSD